MGMGCLLVLVAPLVGQSSEPAPPPAQSQQPPANEPATPTGSTPEATPRVLTNRAGEVEEVPPERTGRVEPVPPEHQVPRRIRGAPTHPLALKKTRDVEAAHGEADAFTFFPFTFAPLMPYLDGMLMFGNTCIQSGAVIESDPLSSAGQWLKTELAKVGIE